MATGKPRILLIDAFNYFYSQFSTNTASDENGEPMGGFVGTIDHVQRLINKFNPQRVVVIFDGPDAGMRRRKLVPDYKGRKAKKKRYASVSMGGDGEVIKVDNETLQLEKTFKFLRQLPVSIVIVPYYEADDIIAHLALANPQLESIICSSDKDYIQLCNEHIFIWSWGRKKLYTPDLVTEDYEVKPENFAYYRAIVGDPSDKLSGIEGVGHKTLLGLMPQLNSVTYDSFEDYWDAIKEIDSDKLHETIGVRQLKKTQTALGLILEQKKKARLMYKMMRLDDTGIKLKALEQTQQQLKEQMFKPLRTFQFKIYCIKNGLEAHIKHYDYWIRPFAALKRQILIKV